MGGKRNRWNIEKKTTGGGGWVKLHCYSSDSLSQVVTERCETSSTQSPVGEILQFKQSKQLFYSDAHFSLAGG